jgi:hypothetical protein
MFKTRVHSEKVKNKEMPQSLEVSKDSQSNDYQMFEISDSLCFCAFVAKLQFSEMTQTSFILFILI